jgi:hypothetical protein
MLSNTRLDGKLKVSSVIAQSYSRYIGIEVTYLKYSASLQNHLIHMSASASLSLTDTRRLTIGSLLIQDILQIFSDHMSSMGKKTL